MADLLREIDEELQRERMLALWSKYKTLVMTLVLGLVVGTASYSAWQEHTATAKIKRSVALYDMLASKTGSERDKLESLQGFMGEFPGKGQTIMARFVAADIHVRAGALPQAVAMLESVALDKTVSDLLRQYAGVLAIQVQLDTGDAAELRKKLEPFAAEGRPWRYAALAMQGMLLAKGGDLAAAEKIFAALADNPAAPGSLGEYASDLSNYYATKR